VVAGSKHGADKNESALRADHVHVWLNFRVVGVLGVGVGVGDGWGLEVVEREEGHRRWVGDPEGDLHGMVGARFGCGRGVVPAADADVRLLGEERMDAGKGKAPPVKLAAEAIDPDAIRVLDFGIVLGIDEGGRGY
jgi:hypothetical protein